MVDVGSVVTAARRAHRACQGLCSVFHLVLRETPLGGHSYHSPHFLLEELRLKEGEQHAYP